MANPTQNSPRRGSVVECVRTSRGRDAPPKGAVGVVVWSGPSRRTRGFRVGFKTDSGRVYFCAGSYVKVLKEAPAPKPQQLTLGVAP